MDQVSVVQGRLAVPSGMGTDVAFAQFTVRIEGLHGQLRRLLVYSDEIDGELAARMPARAGGV